MTGPLDHWRDEKGSAFLYRVLAAMEKGTPREAVFADLAEAAELALIYAARGIPKQEARALAERVIADPARALDTLAHEELGLNPDELGSPLGAAVFSFGSFAIGASIPLAPFLFLVGSPALPLAIGLISLSLFSVGATLSLFTGTHAPWGGLRMLLLGGAAGAATFGIRRLLGVSLSRAHGRPRAWQRAVAGVERARRAGLESDAALVPTAAFFTLPPASCRFPRSRP